MPADFPESDFPELRALDRPNLRLFYLPALLPDEPEWLAQRGIDAKQLEAYHLFEKRNIQPQLHTAQGRPDVARRLVATESITERLAALNFQDEILRRGFFEQPNPIGGDSARCVHSVPVGNCIYYPFRGPRPFVLIAGRYSRGFGRIALWLPNEGIVIALSPGFTPQRIVPLIQEFQAVVAKVGDLYRAYARRADCTGVAILVDTPLFPHHLWNELTGVQRLVDSGLLVRAKYIYVCDEPLGPAEELYPEFKGRIKRCRRSEALRDVFSLGLLLVRPGSVLIPPTVIQRVATVAQRRASPAAQALSERLTQRSKPVLGITLRLINRRWASQRNGIVGLIKALQRRELPFEVILFGYSLAHGHQADAPLKGVLAEERTLCREIARRCPDVTFTPLVGESIFDCILLARHLDFYVANHGTIQHKIGWFSSCPGIVHANRKTIEQGLAFFATLIANLDGMPPTYIPAESVRDVSVGPTEAGVQGRDNLHDYDFDWRELLPPAARALRERHRHLVSAEA